MKILFTILFLAVCLLPNIARADQLADTTTQLRAEAEKGDANAQKKLGDIYERDAVPANGQKGIESDAEAMKWYRKAADQGNPAAAYALGWRYLQGGPDRLRDKIEAAKWYRKAAEDGYLEAQIDLSRRNLGLGVDQAESEKWFRSGLSGYERKAEQGDLGAMSSLCRLYGAEREALPPDYEKAYFWCSVVAQRNSNNPNQHRGWIRPIDQGDADRIGTYLWFFKRHKIEEQANEWNHSHPAPSAAPPPSKEP